MPAMQTNARQVAAHVSECGHIVYTGATTSADGLVNCPICGKNIASQSSPTPHDAHSTMMSETRPHWYAGFDGIHTPEVGILPLSALLVSPLETHFIRKEGKASTKLAVRRPFTNELGASSDAQHGLRRRLSSSILSIKQRGKSATDRLARKVGMSRKETTLRVDTSRAPSRSSGCLGNDVLFVVEAPEVSPNAGQHSAIDTDSYHAEMNTATPRASKFIEAFSEDGNPNSDKILTAASMLTTDLGIEREKASPHRHIDPLFYHPLNTPPPEVGADDDVSDTLYCLGSNIEFDRAQREENLYLQGFTHSQSFRQNTLDFSSSDEDSDEDESKPGSVSESQRGLYVCNPSVEDMSQSSSECGSDKDFEDARSVLDTEDPEADTKSVITVVYHPAAHAGPSNSGFCTKTDLSSSILKSGMLDRGTQSFHAEADQYWPFDFLGQRNPFVEADHPKVRWPEAERRAREIDDVMARFKRKVFSKICHDSTVERGTGGDGVVEAGTEEQRSSSPGRVLDTVRWSHPLGTPGSAPPVLYHTDVPRLSLAKTRSADAVVFDSLEFDAVMDIAGFYETRRLINVKALAMSWQQIQRQASRKTPSQLVCSMANTITNSKQLYERLPQPQNVTNRQVSDGEARKLPPGSWYRYPVHFRLLQIKPWTDNFERMECKLTTFELSESPPYRCLSYVWGKPRNQTIYVDDHPLKITTNLLGFLQRLRAGSRNPDGYLWIDMININQEDVSEVNAQVKIMGSIYAQADQVIGWLGWEYDRIGDGSDDGINHEAEAGREDSAENAVALVKTIAAAMRTWISNGGDPWSGQLSQCAFDTREMYDMLSIDPVPFKTWKALALLLNRKWFERAWVVQEAALAKVLLIICGFEILPWADVVDTSIFLYTSGWFQPLIKLFSGSNAVTVPSGWQVILRASLQDICNVRRKDPKLGRLFPDPFSTETQVNEQITGKLLELLLATSRPSGATDPKDKVYAPFTLIRYILQTHCPAQADALPVDYNLSVTQVYTRATALTLRNRKDFSVLSHVEDRTLRVQPSLPSWVPDFSHMMHNPFRAHMGLQYQALSSRPRHCEIIVSDTGPSTLEVEGTYLDSVASLKPVFDAIATNDIRSWIEFCLNYPSTRYINGQDITEAFWRTIIGDFDGTSCPAKPEVASQFKRYVCVETAVKFHGSLINPNLPKHDDWTSWKSFDHLREKIRSPSVLEIVPSVEELESFVELWRQILVAGKTRLPELKSLCSPSDPYGLALGRMYPHRCFFVSENSHIGLAPAFIRQSDQIWFLSGADVAFVLRPIASRSEMKRFELMGECYVHGLMHGEILQRDKNLLFEKIVLE
ncbi:MAG: hypothetical protein M1820_001964 [Bogoriella megaspora]|nr:MAG: hypothetical protein M1820_001964 [Bogoriella megaspora]